MKLHGNKNITQKSLYLAVALTFNSVMAVAEEVKTAEPKELEEVNVKAASDSAAGGYQATKTRVGKVLQDPHDVPQAITTLTHELMHDQQVGSLREALRNVSGLTFNAAEGGRSGDNMMLRGFYTFGDIYLDGVRDTAQYNRETFNLEQVEVLRGSAAMLFGRGQAGGVINQVSKTAKLTDANVISGSLGEYGYHQFTGDFNKKITDTAAIRLNLMDRSEKNYRNNPVNGDRPELDRNGIAVSFGAGIGTNNELFLNHVYTQTRDVPDYGVSFFNKRTIDRTVATGKIDDTVFYGGDKNFDDSDTNITTATFTHKFSKDAEWRTQLRSADYERAYWSKTPNANTVPAANYSIGGNPTREMDYETLNLQTDFSTKLDIAGMKHQVLTGLEYLKEDSFRHALRPHNLTTGLPYSGTPSAAEIIANGVFYKKGVLATTGTPVKFKADNYAFYVQDIIELIPKWDLLLGMRRDELRADYSSTTSPKLSYGENSYRTGLSWHQNEMSHYYVSFSDSFSPTADLYQLTVKPHPPETSKTLELGAKWLFNDGDLAFRTALYRSVKDWERNTDLESTAAILTKKRRTDGLEFELSGYVAENWEVFAGVAFMDAKILEVAENINATTGQITFADARFEGKRARNTPAATFNLWTTYAFMGNWKIGGGIEAKGERIGYVPSAASANNVYTNGQFDPNKLPGYARVDAMLEYDAKQWAVRLNVKSLLDKTYYDAIYDNGGFSVPANSRTAIVTTEFKFQGKY
ncbi:MAG: TonB-dependent receptor [Methylotenera sp.]|nr:TonB-dependent receptor [Methylotenera sp.]